MQSPLYELITRLQIQVHVHVYENASCYRGGAAGRGATQLKKAWFRCQSHAQ